MATTRRLNRNAGFTLIELLIVIAIIGILAAIAIPNLLNALQRGKQKRTMADMRDLAIAVESYNVDNNYYPTAQSAACPPNPAGLAPASVGTSSFTLLTPTYISQPPTRDGWKFFLYFGRDTPGQQYAIASGGRSHVAYSFPAVCGTTTNFNDEIVYMNGTFIKYPEGPQQ